VPSFIFQAVKILALSLINRIPTTALYLSANCKNKQSLNKNHWGLSTKPYSCIFYREEKNILKRQYNSFFYGWKTNGKCRAVNRFLKIILVYAMLSARDEKSYCSYFIIIGIAVFTQKSLTYRLTVAI